MTADDVIDRVGQLAKLYRHEIGGDVLAFFAEVLLQQLTPDEAHAALEAWAMRETRWPAPAQIIALARPTIDTRDGASDLAQRLLALIRRRGYTWESTCRYDGHTTVEDAIAEELGNTARIVVKKAGGWAAFCRDWGGGESISTMRAQLRDLCMAAERIDNAQKQIAALSPDGHLKLLPPQGGAT